MKYCPKCLLEGKQAELVENAIMNRCVRCGMDYKVDLSKRGRVFKPIKGLKAILG